MHGTCFRSRECVPDSFIAPSCANMEQQWKSLCLLPCDCTLDFWWAQPYLLSIIFLRLNIPFPFTFPCMTCFSQTSDHLPSCKPVLSCFHLCPWLAETLPYDSLLCLTRIVSRYCYREDLKDFLVQVVQNIFWSSSSWHLCVQCSFLRHTDLFIILACLLLLLFSLQCALSPVQAFLILSNKARHRKLLPHSSYPFALAADVMYAIFRQQIKIKHSTHLTAGVGHLL